MKHKSPRSISHRISIRGQRWTIRFVQPNELSKDEAEDEELKGDSRWWLRQIRVDLGMDPNKAREILIHEILHACVHDLDEECVAITADAINRALNVFEHLDPKKRKK